MLYMIYIALFHYIHEHRNIPRLVMMLEMERCQTQNKIIELLSPD